ncbi:hypothetical protein [Methylobacterium oxalidis]|uniref:Uncharacterized protein n=1 Tax=Methylobacterium oxalidis TaxID=944322 RepID=A0A512JC92_9HYPH|nr:hypothetical protein [Methylobacterium oxalidis]GEP07535.1 hypothetical protein MOX02_55730 [Methylobacterium oxalidis]GLS65759.1 hypothetical protein GCM10007888_41410 [Methylobacterium oxalidis]
MTSEPPSGGDPTPTPKPDSTGTNARPRDATIAQTGEGIPDDSGRPVYVDEAEAKRIEKKIRDI